MGTNYYMMSKDKEFVKNNFENEYCIVDSPYLGYEIHLCKMSIGWKTSFQAHKPYKSVKEMCKFFRGNKDKFEIYDEYNDKIELEKFLHNIVNRDKEIEKSRWEYSPNSYSLLERNDEATEDYIECPFDHIEYNEYLKKHDSTYYWREGNNRYFNDDEGYNFVVGDFC